MLGKRNRRIPVVNDSISVPIWACPLAHLYTVSTVTVSRELGTFTLLSLDNHKLWLTICHVLSIILGPWALHCPGSGCPAR